MQPSGVLRHGRSRGLLRMTLSVFQILITDVMLSSPTQSGVSKHA